MGVHSQVEIAPPSLAICPIATVDRNLSDRLAIAICTIARNWAV